MLRIFINPGHDMDLDPGACANGIREVDIALAIGEKVKKTMEVIGYPCQILQSDNLNGETKGKPNVCATANNSGADIFVSIHCNSAANSSAKGTETLVYALDGGKSNILAKCIQAQIVNSLNMIDRGVKARPDLCVLRETSMPAVLVETAFISNEDNASLPIKKSNTTSFAIVCPIKSILYVVAITNKITTFFNAPVPHLLLSSFIFGFIYAALIPVI